VSNLDPELKVKWLVALRSGDFEQGKGRLHEDGHYCCFGVLARVAGHTIEELGSYPCLAFVDSALARSIEGSNYGGRGVQCQLECMNDGVSGHRKHTFSEIADYVEANL
jgi:hypothetical protein